MYFDEPMSADNMSNIGYNSKTNPRNQFCLIDDGAEQSGEESSSGYGFRDGDTAPGAFPQFVRLPPELRHEIWHFYCPDLSVKARVLPFKKWPGSAFRETRRKCLSASDHGALADQTRNLRAMLSTHRESRSIAVRKYPNELAMDTASGTSIVRFRKETDVIFLMELLTDVNYSVPEFGHEIENLAVGLVENFSSEKYFDNETILKVLPGIQVLFPNLKRLFSHWPAMTHATDMEEWCVTECVHSYMVKACRGWEPYSDEYTDTLFCWPDLDAHPDFARSLVPKMCSLEEMEETGVEFWPIVEFESETSMQMYDMMRRLYWNSYLATNGGNGPDSEHNYGNANGTDADQHGSEGIGHDEIMEPDGSSESELSLGETGLFSCRRSDDVQALAEFDVEPHSRRHKRKAMAVATEDEEEDEMGHVHDDDDGKPQSKRSRLSRQIPGADNEEEEEEEEDPKPDQSEIKPVSTRRVRDRSWNLFIFSQDGSEGDGRPRKRFRE
ncbi:hypothetical protein E4U56_003372 [Claviceps arundinis]|uniref:2EXR domain-containing protein n=1 Tax=Claviceps arundinis TaxID=1623583 RepID=A0A9P7MY89_9HYPO|nr:hypothetical protein E4U56_003372 [Claviceps arundinis]